MGGAIGGGIGGGMGGGMGGLIPGALPGSLLTSTLAGSVMAGNALTGNALTAGGYERLLLEARRELEKVRCPIRKLAAGRGPPQWDPSPSRLHEGPPPPPPSIPSHFGRYMRRMRASRASSFAAVGPRRIPPPTPCAHPAAVQHMAA
jgi:hypothetical protein